MAREPNDREAVLQSSAPTPGLPAPAPADESTASHIEEECGDLAESAQPAAPPSFEGEVARKVFGLANDAVVQVFRHIERFGSITESEVTTILGSPRAFRRFSSEFERYATMVPFRVGIEMGANGKRYVKEGSR